MGDEDDGLRRELKRLRKVIEDQNDRLAVATERLEQSAARRDAEPVTKWSARSRTTRGYATNDELADAFARDNPESSFLERQQVRGDISKKTDTTKEN